MKIALFCKLSRAISRAVLLLLSAAVMTVPAAAEVPEWLRTAAHVALPSYPEKTDAVILLDEQETRVKDSGEIRTTRRLAYKILRPEGRSHATFVVSFDQETKVTFLKAWSISARGEEEVKEKDAVETGFTAETLYSDLRRKIITAPSADPGSIVGYEYEQKRRPAILQDVWWIQDPNPVLRGRFVLQLPKGWEHRAVWIHHAKIEPHAGGENEWVWEVQNLQGVEDELSMPPWQAMAGRLAVTYFPREGSTGHGSWAKVGQWYGTLSAGVREVTPEIRQKVTEVTKGAPSLIEKIRRLAAFAQGDIRYVSIQIGIGGYRPHAADVVLRNRYGDCKDKATLLSALLKELGLESYFVLANSGRGAVAPEFPSMLNFNHVILAISLPAEVDTASLFASSRHERLGPLLYFDPTSTFTPLGYLPTELQGSSGLLVTEQGGELVSLPVLAPSTNRLLRAAEMTLGTDGSLSGVVREIYQGAPATEWRARYLSAEIDERQKMLEDRFYSALGGVALEGAQAIDLHDISQNLVLDFRLKANSYAQKAGDLLLVRPRLMGWKGELVGEEEKERKQAFVFDTATLETDSFAITLPDGYIVDELPEPMQAVYDFGEYRSKTVVDGKVLRYARSYTIKSLQVPVERFGDLRKFFARIGADQRAYAILRKASPASAK